MTETYRISPAAQRELEDKKAELLRYRKARLITSDQARSLYAGFRLDLLKAGANVVVDESEANVLVICDGCKRDHIMRADILYFKCKCSPHKERPTFHRTNL